VLQYVAVCCSVLQCVMISRWHDHVTCVCVCEREQTQRHLGLWGSACTSEQERWREQENDNVRERDRESALASVLQCVAVCCSVLQCVCERQRSSERGERVRVSVCERKRG